MKSLLNVRETSQASIPPVKLWSDGRRGRCGQARLCCIQRSLFDSASRRLLLQLMTRTVRTKRASTSACKVRSFDPHAVAAARRKLLSSQGYEQTAECFSILAHPWRLRLLVALEGRALCVCDCAQVLGAKLPATSQHLRELRRIGAITFRAEGKMAYYRLADRRWLAVAEAVQKIIANPLALRASA